MTDPITQFIPTNSPIFDDDPSTQADRRQRNIIRTKLILGPLSQKRRKMIMTRSIQEKKSQSVLGQAMMKS